MTAVESCTLSSDLGWALGVLSRFYVKAAAATFAEVPGGARGYQVFTRCFERGLLVRVTGDIIALSPPLIIESEHMELAVGALETALDSLESALEVA